MSRPRFSLLSFLLLTALVSVSVSYWQLRQEHATVQLENQKLRDADGHLVVCDPEKAYVRQAHSDEELTWKCRVYLPEGKTFWLYQKRGNIPTNYYSDPLVSPSRPMKTGVFDISFSFKETNGKWVLGIQIGSSRTVSSVSEEVVMGLWAPESEWMMKPHHQQEFDPSKPIPLFNRRWSKVDGTSMGVVAFFDSAPEERRKRLTAPGTPAPQP